MKFKSLALCALLVASLVVIVDKAQAYKRAYHTFVFTGSNELLPTDYTAGSIPTCSFDGNVCALDIPDADIYTQAEVTQLSKPQSYVGQPKADLTSTGELGAQISTFPASGETDVTRVNDRLIYEKF